jgi:hypothetical protein
VKATYRLRGNICIANLSFGTSVKMYKVHKKFNCKEIINIINKWGTGLNTHFLKNQIHINKIYINNPHTL